MNLKTFKKISKQVEELEKANIKFNVLVNNDSIYTVDQSAAYWEPTHYEVSTLKQLSDVQAVLGKPIALQHTNNTIKIEGLNPVACVRSVEQLINDFKAKPTLKLGLPTLKFHSSYAKHGYWYNFKVNIITEKPTEQQEGEITYRYIGDANECLYCIPHTHELYNYLDKGFFFCRLDDNRGKEKLVITNELTLDTYLCMVLVWINPAYIKQLANSCYINANQAKLLRVKFEKDLKEKKAEYEVVRNYVLKEYEKTANSNLLQRVAEGKIPHATYNNIKFTKKLAIYETISIEAEDLLDVLQANVAFDDRTDIYTVTRDYVRYVINRLEEAEFTAEKTDAEYQFVINDIPITLKRTDANTRRYVNGHMINKIEVEEVAFQAACYKDADTYEKFVKSVSKMSLKWHKALAYGVPVKINKGLSYSDYHKAEAPQAGPRIRFIKEGNDYKLIVGEDQSVKVKFNECLTRLKTLNRQTNNNYAPGSYNQKNHEWAQRQLVQLLKDCCTFDKKTVTVTEVDEVVIDEADAEKKPLMVDGKPQIRKVKKKDVVVTKECTLSDEQAKFVGRMAEEFYVKAVAKSEIALANAVKNTGATIVQFKGEDHYRVEGKLRKYVVNKRTNEVYNQDTGGYICIVEPGHQIQVGFDAVVTRLYALKNDSVMMAKVGTLR